MPINELNLESFNFPPGLPNGNANFRFVADIRYIDAEGELATAHSVMPGLDTFWECDKDKSTAANYVRNATNGFNMALINSWDRLILLTKATKVHSIQVKIFDVDRRDFWDKFKEILGPIITSLLGIAKTVTTAAIPKPVAFLTGAFGTAIEDVESFTLKKLANGEDRLLCKIAFDSIPNTVGTHPLLMSGVMGSKGTYDLGLKLTIV